MRDTQTVPENRKDVFEVCGEMTQCETTIHIGDTLCLRSMRGDMCVCLDDASSGVTWNPESESCLFTIYPAVGVHRESCHAIQNGAVVCLFAPNGYFLSFDGERLAANRPYYVAGPSAEFIVHVGGDGVLRNGGKLLLRNRASLQLLEVASQDYGESETDVENTLTPSAEPDLAHVADVVESGCFFVQKVSDKDVEITQTPPRKRRVSFSSVKSRSRLLMPKLPRHARRQPQDCSYFCKPLQGNLLMRSAAIHRAVAVA